MNGRSWVAWLTYGASSTDDARSRLPLVGGNFPLDYKMLDGTVVFPKDFNFDVVPADGGTALPSAPIRINEKGETMASNLVVWTGSLDNGHLRDPTEICGGWNLATTTPPDGGQPPYGRIGFNINTPFWSSSAGDALCSEAHYLFCFEATPR